MNTFGNPWEWAEEWARKKRGVGGRRSGEMLRRLAGEFKVPDRE